MPSGSAADIYDGTVYLGTATGGGQNGTFYFDTPTSLKDNQVHLIGAYFSGTRNPLQYSPLPLQCPSGSSGYTYAVTDAFSEDTSVNSTYWQSNGTISFSRPYGIYGGGSLIGKTGLAGVSTTDQEVLATLSLGASISGLVNYIYLFASQTALNSGRTYLAVGLSGQQYNGNGQYTAQLVVTRVNSSGSTQLLSTPIGFQSPLQIRAAAATPTSTTSLYRGQTVVNVMVNGGVYTVPAGTTVSSGMPGVGTYAYTGENYVMEAQLGPADNTQPAAVNTNTVNTDIYFNSVTAQWEGATDSNGGTVYYYVNRAQAIMATTTFGPPGARTPRCTTAPSNRKTTTPTTLRRTTSTATPAPRRNSAPASRRSMPSTRAGSASSPTAATGAARASRSTC